jgi:hypothetical protein
MAAVLSRLTDDEIERLCRLPRRIKPEVFAPAEEWLAKYGPGLAKEYPGKHIVINAADLTYCVGDSFDKAYKAYVEDEEHGPSPSSGRPILAVRL